MEKAELDRCATLGGGSLINTVAVWGKKQTETKLYFEGIKIIKNLLFTAFIFHEIISHPLPHFKMASI